MIFNHSNKSKSFKNSALKPRMWDKKLLYKLIFFSVGLATLVASAVAGVVNLDTYTGPGHPILNYDATKNPNDPANFIFNFFSFFTIWSVIAAVLLFAFLIIYHNSVYETRLLSSTVRIAVGSYVSVTMLIFFVALLPEKLSWFIDNPYSFFNTFFQHLVLPTGTIFYIVWIAGVKKINYRQFTWQSLPGILIIPVIYLIYSLVKGEYFYSYVYDSDKKQWVWEQFYPYWFFNYHKTTAGLSGKAWLTIFTFVILFLFIGFSFLYVWVNNLRYLQRRAKEKQALTL